MPCTDQRNRMEDKETDWDVAIAERRGKERLFYVAAAGVGVSCGAAFFSLGIAGPACAAAIAAETYAAVEKDTAREKEDAAADAYLQAVAHYGTCLAKLNRRPGQ